MRHRYEKNPTDYFRPRLTLTAGAMFFLMIALLLRLFVLSVANHDQILVKAEQQYLVRRAVEPRRGVVYAIDAEAGFGREQVPEEMLWKPLAGNRRVYDLSVVPRNLKDPAEVAMALTAWVKIEPAELQAKIDNDKYYLPPLAKGLSEEDKDTIRELNLAGVYLTERDERYYPEGSLAAHILGFVNAENKGNYGIEQEYDAQLAGSGGEVLAERDVLGRLLSEENQTPVRDGQEIVLTIDRNVQGYVETVLKDALETYQAEGGTVVVMDVKTGALVALASLPTFKPAEYRQVAANDETSRFINPAVSAVWEPGSIFKTVVMAAALDAGLIEPETEGVFSNQVVVDGFTIHTAENKAFGRETMTQVLENSDNVAMVWLADQLGNDRMYAALEKFGFGKATGIDLPGEISGRLPDLKGWHNTTRATLSFGQGVSVTPVQMTAALAALANGGLMMQPHAVNKIIGPDGELVTDVTAKVSGQQIISASAAAKINRMMVSVVENGHGKRAKVKGYQIAGKTGTAQIPDPSGGYYEDRHIGGFGGFFPADDPRFAMVVKLDQPKTVKFAESSAAPTFGEIAKFMLNYYRIPPTEPID